MPAARILWHRGRHLSSPGRGGMSQCPRPLLTSSGFRRRTRHTRMPVDRAVRGCPFPGDRLFEGDGKDCHARFFPCGPGCRDAEKAGVCDTFSKCQAWGARTKPVGIPGGNTVMGCEFQPVPPTSGLSIDSQRGFLYFTHTHGHSRTRHDIRHREPPRRDAASPRFRRERIPPCLPRHTGRPDADPLRVYICTDTISITYRTAIPIGSVRLHPAFTPVSLSVGGIPNFTFRRESRSVRA